MVSGALWRLELEHHGWGGLNWLSYFHLAIPIGLFLFLLWFNVYISMSIKKRIALNLIALSVAYAHFYWLINAVNKVYSRSPLAMLESFSQPEWVREAYGYSILFIPIVFALMVISFLRLFKFKRSYWRVLLFTLAIAGAFLSAVILLDITNHRGSADEIHALKSGIVIPFLFLSLGTLVVKKGL